MSKKTKNLVVCSVAIENTKKLRHQITFHKIREGHYSNNKWPLSSSLPSHLSYLLLDNLQYRNQVVIEENPRNLKPTYFIGNVQD